jgi:hypothetical protein
VYRTVPFYHKAPKRYSEYYLDTWTNPHSETITRGITEQLLAGKRDLTFARMPKLYKHTAWQTYLLVFVASFREGKIQTRKTNRVSMTGTCMSLS